MSAVNGGHPQEPVSPTTTLRLRLLEIGCRPLPAAVGKEVFLTEWPTRRIDGKEVLAWDPRVNEWPSTGNDCSRHPGLDLDIRHQEAAEACERRVREWFDGRGELLVRFGLAPKRLIPFRTDTPFKKRLLAYRAPDGERHRIEFLATASKRSSTAITPGAKQTTAGTPTATRSRCRRASG